MKRFVANSRTSLPKNSNYKISGKSQWKQEISVAIE